MKIETLDVLPGENDEHTVTSRRVRRECDNCGEPAHYRDTYLLPNYRRNPASSAYGHDDCSYCVDAEAFRCRTCKEQDVAPRGYVDCSTFPATAGFAHMFLVWVEVRS